jgi:histidine triad (HIT) family protein
MADCLFCRMISGEIKAKTAYEDKDLLAIHDINPQAPVHLLVIPKKHIEKISDLQPGDTELIGKVVEGARNIAAQNAWSDYRLVFNNGPESGQSVFHIHLHLLSGRRMTWPPG